MTMTTTDQAVAFAPQPGNAPGTDGAGNSKLVAVSDPSYRWLPTTKIALATVQDQKPLPMEMSGALLPRSVYKSGAYGAGAIEFIPRVGGSHLHWILMSMASSYKNVMTGARSDHYYGTGDAEVAPWDPTSEVTKAATGGGPNKTDYFMSVKHLFPAPDANSSLTTRSAETFEDVRIPAFSLNFNPAGPVTAQLGLVARVPRFIADTSAGAASYWNPSYIDLAAGQPGLPDNSSFVLGCKGSINMPAGGSSLDISATGASVSIQALMTSPDDEKILFSFHPETYRILARNVVVTINVKRNVLPVMRGIYFNDGDDWSPIVWDNAQPFSIIAETASDAEFGGGTFAGEIEFWAKDIEWTMKPIENSAGKILGAQIQGTVTEPEGGTAAWYVRLTNDRDILKDEAGVAVGSGTYYDWPT